MKNMKFFRSLFIHVVSLISITSFSCISKTQQTVEKGESTMKFVLTSTAFQAGERIPGKYTGQGEDLSIPLQWTNAPEGTKSFALICDDPDASGRTWVHWVIFNIPANTIHLKEGIKTTKKLDNGSIQGITDFGTTGYGGPMPPPGSQHRYFFRLYALDTMLDLAPGSTKDELMEKIKGHVLADAELMGTYSR